MIITREEDLVFFERIEDDSLNCEEEKNICMEDPDEADIAHDLQMIGEYDYE